MRIQLPSARAVAFVGVFALAAACSDQPLQPGAPDEQDNIESARRTWRSTTTNTTNAAPTAWIITPEHQASFAQGASVAFSGAGGDNEDGALSGASLVWKTSIDGQIGTGKSFSKSNLSVGTHTITLTATDSKGLTYSHNRVITVTASTTATTPPPNQPPSASIQLPSSNITVVQGTAVAFAGSGADPESGALSGAALAWSSSLNGALGTGASISSSTLVVGTHTITLTARDSAGASGTASRTITVTAPVAITPPANQAPSATILSPSSNISVVQGIAVVLSGSGSDPESGALSGSALSWSSSLNGALGTGASISTSALVVGTHTITLTARDAAGATGTASRVVTVSAPVSITPPTSSGGVEPAGMTAFVDRDWGCVFSSSCDSGWAYSPNISGKLSVVADLLAPRSASSVGQMTYPVGFSGGSGPGVAERGLGNGQARTIYMSSYIKYSSNWQAHSSGVNKMTYLYARGFIPFVYTVAYGSSSSGMVSTVALQRLAAAYSDGRGNTSTEVFLKPNLGASGAVVPGRWHRYEYVITLNTPGVSDGRVEAWFDGVKTHDFSGIRFVASGGTSAWETFQWAPVWGGVGGSVTSQMSQQMDHVYISGK